MNFDKFSKDDLQDARRYVALMVRASADAAIKGTDYGPFGISVTKRLEIAHEYHVQAKAIEAGELDHVFAIKQSMYYFLTGRCVAFLPEPEGRGE